MMTALNLATVFGPTILRPGREESFADAGKMEIANAVTEKIIQFYDFLFNVGSERLPQGSTTPGIPVVGTPIQQAAPAPITTFAPPPAIQV
jgi:hypothetical protein